MQGNGSPTRLLDARTAFGSAGLSIISLYSRINKMHERAFWFVVPAGAT
jgi:hypothetical protein